MRWPNGWNIFWYTNSEDLKFPLATSVWPCAIINVLLIHNGIAAFKHTHTHTHSARTMIAIMFVFQFPFKKNSRQSEESGIFRSRFCWTILGLTATYTSTIYIGLHIQTRHVSPNRDPFAAICSFAYVCLRTISEISHAGTPLWRVTWKRDSIN